MKNENRWQQHLIREARTIGSPSSEATWEATVHPVYGFLITSSGISPKLLPLPTGIGFLPGFEHVEENVWLRSAVDAINKLGDRGLPLRGTPTLVQRLALVGVTSEFASLPNCPVGVTVQDAVTHVLGQDPGFVDDMATGKLVLFKRGLVSLPRVQAGLVPLSSVVLPRVRSLLEDDATSPLMQGDCAERFEGRLAFDARLVGNPRLSGRFLGDLFAKCLITMGTAKARVAPLFVPKRDGCQRLIFETREANHRAATIHTT